MVKVYGWNEKTRVRNRSLVNYSERLPESWGWGCLQSRGTSRPLLRFPGRLCLSFRWTPQPPLKSFSVSHHSKISEEQPVASGSPHASRPVPQSPHKFSTSKQGQQLPPTSKPCSGIPDCFLLPTMHPDRYAEGQKSALKCASTE